MTQEHASKRWRILLTRPSLDAEISQATLEAKGHKVFCAPSLQIEPALGAKLRIHHAMEDGPQAIIITSANGIRAFAEASENRAVPVFCVGESSKLNAEMLGFTKVYSADGDIEALQRLIKQTCNAEDGPFLHVAGSVQAGDLKQVLEAKGFVVERVVGYDAKPVESLPADVRTALSQSEVEVVLCYSKRSLALFEALLKKESLDYLAKGIVLLCLPVQVDASLPWREVHCASAPNEDALFALIDTL